MLPCSLPAVGSVSAPFPGTSLSNPQAVLDAILRFTIGKTDPGGREVLERFMADHKGQLNSDTLTELLMLITAMPEYQLT